MSVFQTVLGPLAVAWKKDFIEIDPPAPPDPALAPPPPKRSNRLELRLKNISGHRLSYHRHRQEQAPGYDDKRSFPKFSRVYLSFPIGSGSRYLLTGEEARQVTVSASDGWEVLSCREEAEVARWMLCAGEGGSYLQPAGLDDDKGSILVTFDNLPIRGKEAFSVLVLDSRDISYTPSPSASSNKSGDKDAPPMCPDARSYLPVMKKYRPPTVLLDFSPKNAGLLDTVQFKWLSTFPVIKACFLPDPEGVSRLAGQTGRTDYTLTESLNFALRADYAPGRFIAFDEPESAEEEGRSAESLYQRLRVDIPEPEIADFKAVRCMDTVYAYFSVGHTWHAYLNHGGGRVECETEQKVGGGRTLMAGRAVLHPVTASEEGLLVTLTCLGRNSLVSRTLTGDPSVFEENFVMLNIFFQMTSGNGRDCDYLVDWSLADLKETYKFENLRLLVENEGQMLQDLSAAAASGSAAFQAPSPGCRLHLTGERRAEEHAWKLDIFIPPLVNGGC